jgi:hypothetical protein
MPTRSKMILFALVAIIAVAPQYAHAVDLQDCSMGTTDKRLTCLQQNIVLLNSSYQQVVTELRSSIADLQTKVAAIPKPPDLSVFVRKDQTIKLGFDNNHCLSWFAGESGVIPANPKPIQIQTLVGFQDCGGAPPWSFH